MCNTQKKRVWSISLGKHLRHYLASIATLYFSLQIKGLLHSDMSVDERLNTFGRNSTAITRQNAGSNVVSSLALCVDFVPTDYNFL